MTRAEEFDTNGLFMRNVFVYYFNNIINIEQQNETYPNPNGHLHLNTPGFF
jgi:hypothetical protein